MLRIDRVAWTAAALLFLSAGAAQAAEEEIQVYVDDLDKPGHFGLDTHINYVISGFPLTNYVGEQQSTHRLRITPEWSYGLTNQIELGLYLPLSDYQDGKYTVDGYKFRIKAIAPHKEEGWYWGGNFEIGEVDRKLDINPWNAELKGILGWHGKKWDVAVNSNIDWAVTGPQRGSPTVQIATKIDYKLTEVTAIGIESYDGVGSFDNFGILKGQGHEIYGAVDTSLGKGWDLNFGVGRGYSGDPDKWIAKMIISVPIDPRGR